MNLYLSIKRIEMAVTYRCISHCRHCQVSEVQRMMNPSHLAPDLAERAVREVASVSPVNSLMTWGGEPLLYPDTVCAAHAAARDCGMQWRTIITSLGTPVGEEDFRRLARRLKDSGVTDMYLSVDAFHQEWIPLEVVRRNTLALVEVGIGYLAWNVSFLVSPDADNRWNARTHQILKELAGLPVHFDLKDAVIVQPLAHAPENLAEFFPPRRPVVAGRCGDLPYTAPPDRAHLLGITPDGSLELCFGVRIGNLAQGHAGEICERYNPYADPLLRTIIQQGPAGLVDEARRRGLSVDPRGWYTVCEMCLAMREKLKSHVM